MSKKIKASINVETLEDDIITYKGIVNCNSDKILRDFVRNHIQILPGYKRSSQQYKMVDNSKYKFNIKDTRVITYLQGEE